MSDEKIDHAALANDTVEYSAEMNPEVMGERATHALGIAQVHATLALVEQQRIANLLALAERGVVLAEELSMLGDEATSGLITTTLTPATPFSGPDEIFTFREEIKSALGLS